MLIGGIALLLFGGKKLPEMMRGLGQGVKEFKKGVHEEDSSMEEKEEQDIVKQTGEKEKGKKDEEKKE